MPTIQPANFPVLNPDKITAPDGKNRPTENRQFAIVNPGTNDEVVRTTQNTASVRTKAQNNKTDDAATDAAEKSRNNKLLFYHPNKSKIKQPHRLGQIIDIKI